MSSIKEGQQGQGPAGGPKRLDETNAGSSTVPKPGSFTTEPYRLQHGPFDITVLSDGFIMLPAWIILPDTPADERPAILERLGGTPQSAPFHVNIPLIRTGNDLILVDNGSGDKFQASAGTLAANLKSAGVDPASITKVVFTHIHPDHAGVRSCRTESCSVPMPSISSTTQSGCSGTIRTTRRPCRPSCTSSPADRSGICLPSGTG